MLPQKGISPDGQAGISRNFFANVFHARDAGEVAQILTNLSDTEVKTIQVMLRALGVQPEGKDIDISFERGMADLGMLHKKIVELNITDLSKGGGVLAKAKEVVSTVSSGVFKKIDKDQLAAAIVQASKSSRQTSVSGTSSSGITARKPLLTTQEQAALDADIATLHSNVNAFIGDDVKGGLPTRQARPDTMKGSAGFRDLYLGGKGEVGGEAKGGA